MNVQQLAINTTLLRHLAWRVCIDGTDVSVNVQNIVVRIKHGTLNIRNEYNVLFSGRKIEAIELHTDIPLSDGRDSICFLIVTPTGQRIHITVEPEKEWKYVQGDLYKGNVLDQYGDRMDVYRALPRTKQL